MSILEKNHIVWDKWIRLSHLLVAVVVLLNLYVLEEGDPPHRYLGYFAVGTVVLRFFYGFVSKNKPHSFSQFPFSLSAIKKFILFKLDPNKHPVQDYPGHNPLASWTYLLIWFCILCLGVTGFMMGTDLYFGEEWVQEVHAKFTDALQILIILHFMGIVLDAIQFKRKTWMGMINGRK